MPMCSFANFKLIMSHHRKELRGAPKAQGPRPWPVCKSVTAFQISVVHILLGACSYSDSYT